MQPRGPSKVRMHLGCWAQHWEERAQQPTVPRGARLSIRSVARELPSASTRHQAFKPMHTTCLDAVPSKLYMYAAQEQDG